MEDVQNIGGTPGVIKFMMDNGMFDGDQMTVTGKTHRQNLEDMNHPGLTPGQEIIRPLSNPIKPTGHLQIMYGNLCPGGGVAKITGKEGETFTVRFGLQVLMNRLWNKPRLFSPSDGLSDIAVPFRNYREQLACMTASLS
jgi:dihydroxyacid dehydratase/phosphogluconate dehydratase